MEYKLIHPFQWDGKKVESIELRRPKGKHLKKISQAPNMGDLLAIASKISDYPPPFFDDMDGEDCIEVCGKIGDFLSSGHETATN